MKRTDSLNLTAGIALLCLIILALAACSKVDLPLEDNQIDDDPNIAIHTDYTVALSTYKIDSFVTSSHSIFTVGYHVDPQFGTIHATSYSELQIPTENEVHNQNVIFDSLVLLLNPNGHWYGDTLAPFRLSVHQLLENIENEESTHTDFYNLRQFAFDPTPLGITTLTIRPRARTPVRIKLASALGQNLLNKLRTNNDSIQNQETFKRFFKGISLQADSMMVKALYYLKSDSAGLVRLHYTLQGAIPQKKYIDFPLNASRQFNSIRYRHTGTSLSVFPPNKTTVISSTQTGNQAFLHSNMGSYIKLDFPSILNLKESHPYVRVLKAELVIKPAASSSLYPYQLPQSLFLYVTNSENQPTGVLQDASGENAQTGNLFIDPLFGEKTQYTYDVTSFINTLISEGHFSTSSLMLVPPSGITDASLDRLILENQVISQNVQLKLYVLGL